MTERLDELARAESAASQEEQLAALYFIAGAVAFSAGWPIFGWLMVTKGIIDILSAILRWSRVRTLRARSTPSKEANDGNE